MADPVMAKVTRDKPRVRRSILLSVMSSVFAIVALEMAFPQSTLTASMPDTVDMADMTWVEVRSAIERGYTTAIVPTGGIEQNGDDLVEQHPRGQSRECLLSLQDSEDIPRARYRIGEHRREQRPENGDEQP